MTGAQANNWKNADNYTVTEAYIDGTVKAMVVDMKGAKLPGATSDKSYAVILSDIMSGKDNTQIADLWTSEGPVEEATINGDDLKKNMVYEFTMNGDEYDLEAVTETVVGVITEIDGEYITVKADGQAAKEYILTDDTIQLFVDTDKGVGSTEGTLAENDEFESGKYYANAIVILGDVTDEGTEIDCIVFDNNGELQDANGESIVINK